MGFYCSHSLSHFSSWPIWLIKVFPRANRRRKETERTEWLWPKHIPGCSPIRAGSYPLNQKYCSESASIKQILKECFIHSAFLAQLRCNWFPPSHFAALFGSLYSTFCCLALWWFWWFQILLKPGVNLSRPFVLLLFHWCDMCPNILYHWIIVMSAWHTSREQTSQSRSSKCTILGGYNLAVVIV